MEKSGLIIASPASFLIFVLPLTVVPLGLLRFPPVMRFLFLALRPWGLLLTLCSPWLPPLILDSRAALLRRSLDRG
jgi:hypothetical protein